MRLPLAAAALVVALPVAGSAHAEDGPFSANIALVSDYAFRGISQTDERPALQGGFDYAHASGFYAGVWGSNVSWLADAADDVSNSLEVDLYAGYAGEAGAIGYDIGLLQYYYPGSYGASYRAGAEKPHTLEAYLGLSWEFLSFKYSHSLTDLFGYTDSDGSQYYELGAEHDLGNGFTLTAHAGYSDIRGQDNYTDWKVGVNKEYGGFDFGLHYVDTDINGVDEAEERVVLSIAKSF
ncbi:TorF family putative porin [Thauera aromatica]|uniref:TorF family putative porin n=1 Tax=Thauera aromatica TaxID=59405 RepID=UPI001FFD8C42|nr:TorF family putative porin [Thauera aromatica]MCK2096194.1 TorF family putative porin [Thauera aromatica]